MIVNQIVEELEHDFLFELADEDTLNSIKTSLANVSDNLDARYQGLDTGRPYVEVFDIRDNTTVLFSIGQ